MTLLLESAARIFADTATPTVLAASERGEFARAAWDAVTEACLHLALLPDQAGGFGVPTAEALGLLRVAGHHALPLPLAETMLAGWLLATAGLPVPTGRLAIATGPEFGAAGHLSGTAHGVAWGRPGGNVEQIARIVRKGGKLIAHGSDFRAIMTMLPTYAKNLEQGIANGR